MKENKSLKMADTMSAKAESNHERNGDHLVEEVASSPKAPPRRKRQGKALSGDDEEKENENESESKENVPSVKPSPSKPPLPPRPADFSPRPAPTSAEKTLQTHPTKDPPSSQIPQPAKTPSQPPDHSRRPSNKNHSSPVPKRPPQPSRQTSVKTITPPQQEIKSPEAVRTITQHATQNKTSKTKSDRTTKSNEEQTVQRGVNRGKPQRPPEPNCEGIKTKPAQDTTPEAGIRDEKKLNRPPRPAVPPQPVRTVKDDEAIMPDKQKSSEMKGPPKPKRTLSKEGTVEVNVTTDSAQIPGAVVATEVNRPPKPPRVTASQEQEKIQSPKLNRPPEPSRPTNDLNSSPIHVEGKKDEIVKTQEHEQKEDKPNRPSLPRQRSAADGRKVAKHKENFESLDISKSSKVDRPPPSSRQTVLKEGEKDEIVLDSKCLNKTGEEKETHSERENVEKLKGTGAGKERRSVSFIVQSFTKTEFGSLRKNVSRKPQQDDRTHVRVNIKESKKPQKPPPPLLPKPTRERLPSPGSKGSGTKEKMEKKSEEQEVKDQGGRKKSSQDRAVENGSAIVETGNDDRGEDNVKDKHTDGSLQKEGKLTAAVNERVNMVESGVSGNQQGLTGDTDDIKEEHTTAALGQNEQLGGSKDKERTPRMSRLGNEAGGTSLDTHVSKGKKRTKLGLLSDSGEQKEEMSVLQKTDERDRTKSVSESVKYASDLENQQDDKNKKEKDKTREKSKNIEKSFEIGDSQEPNAQNFREVEDFEEKNSLSGEKYLSDKKVVVETGIQEKNKHEKSSFDALKYLGDEPNVSDKANEEQAQEGEKPEDLVKGKCIVEERLLCEKRHQVDELKSGKRQNVQDEKEEEKTRDMSKKLNEENNVECQENGRKVIEEESKINEKEAHSVEQETKDKDVIWKVSGVVVSESGTKVIDQSEETYPNETNVDSEKICVLNETETFASEDKLEENKVDRQRSEQEMNSEHSTLEEKNLTVPMERNKTLVNENEPAVAGRAADLRDTEGFVGESDEVGTPEDGATAEDNTGTAGVEKPSITEDSKVRLVSMEEDEGKKSKNAACEVATNNDSIKLSTQKLPAPSSNIKSEKIEETPIKPSVQSPKKKPPPKPKRTSSLKRNSRPLSGESDDLQDRFPPVVEAKMTEESTSKITNTGHVLSKRSTPNNHKKPSMSSPKNVTFQESVVQSQETSTAIVRSKSFTSSNKRRSVSVTSNENKTGKKSEARWERLTRSMSFGAGTKKKSQPPRPPPPTFFVQTTPTPDVTEEKNEKFTFDQELEKLDVPLENKAKHDSLISENTTDSETDSEKEDLPQKSKTYYISREILSTERTFVDTLKLVSKDFKEALESGNKKLGRQVIPEETLNDIMLNISQIYDFDKDFFKALEDRMKTWDDQQRIGDIIKKYSPFLKMYKTYIQGYDNAMAVLSDALKKYPLFAEIVREFESSERCQNLTIGMYMLKPIQRIPSYRLLLIDYLKHLSKDSLDHKDVSDALTIVSEVATHINEDMKRVDKFEEVLKVQRSLVGQVEIVKPGRDLIKEGMLMKLCRKDMQPRMFYLFTDVLLYTTPVANNQFRLNLSLPLGEITMEIPASPDFDNEFSIISTKKSFTLSSSTAEERDGWLEALVNASNEINKKKITFHLAKKEKMDALADSLQESDDKDFKLGSKAPVWIPDARVTMCMLCTDDFTTVTNRRHHCRACGKVICGSCSSNSAPLPYLNFEAARVCDNCYDVLSKDLTDTTPTSVAATTVPENVETTKTDSLSRSTPVPKPSAAELANRFKKNKKPTPRKNRKSIPSVLREVQASEESTISGYLSTRKGKKWQKRWYVVKDNVLYAYKASSDVVALDTCPLLGFDVRGPEKVDGDSKKIVFQLIHAGTPPLILQTDNLSSAERWVTTLRRSTMLPH